MNNNHILIIDRDEAFTRATEAYFSQLGIDVISTTDGVDGYRFVTETQPAMVMLDTVQTNLDGFQICKLIKMDDRFENIPIVFVSSNDMQEDVMKAEQAGCDLFLLKPIVLDQLTEELINLIMVNNPAEA
tara:strand:- start:6095 stop:6484 length:390 start_codon:yes stop_codon:yes gene_type:complete